MEEGGGTKRRKLAAPRRTALRDSRGRVELLDDAQVPSSDQVQPLVASRPAQAIPPLSTLLIGETGTGKRSFLANYIRKHRALLRDTDKFFLCERDYYEQRKRAGTLGSFFAAFEFIFVFASVRSLASFEFLSEVIESIDLAVLVERKLAIVVTSANERRAVTFSRAQLEAKLNELASLWSDSGESNAMYFVLYVDDADEKHMNLAYDRLWRASHPGT